MLCNKIYAILEFVKAFLELIYYEQSALEAGVAPTTVMYNKILSFTSMNLMSEFKQCNSSLTASFHNLSSTSQFQNNMQFGKSKGQNADLAEYSIRPIFRFFKVFSIFTKL